MKYFFTMFIFFLILITQINAQNEYSVEVEVLSFEDLMKMAVTAASKKAESLNDAPGIISVISKKEIDGFASRNLGEILNRVVGSVYLSANVFTNNLISLRGQETTPYNNHILFLLNGRPLRDPITGGLNNLILTGFPVSIIDHIEIIRGPGSVLYGSCAYSGVVNIVTETGKEDGSHFEAELQAGSHGALGQNIAGVIKSGELNLSLAANHFYEDGPEFEFTDYMNKHNAAHFDRNNWSFLMNMNYKNLKINQYYGYYKPYALEGADNKWDLDTDPHDNNIQAMYLFDLGYTNHFTDKWTAEANINFIQRNWTTSGFIDNTGRDIMLELLNRIVPSDNVNILVGATYTSSDYSGGLIRKNEMWSGSIYSQIDVKIIEQLKLIGGFQYNKIEGIDGNLSPRLGAVANFNENFGMKLLYSQAFRKGYPLETSFDVIVFKGNLALKPELINTFEAQAFFQNEKIQASLTYYNSTMKDIISRKLFVDPNVQPMGWYLQYVNGGEHKFWGIEIESKISLMENLMAVASYAYQTNENEAGIENATLHPQNYIKAGLLYEDPSLSIGVFNSYFSEPNKVKVLNPAVTVINKEAEAFNLLSAKFSIELLKTFNSPSKNKLYLFVEVDNLLGEDIRYPEYTTRGVNTLIPLYNGAEFLFGLKYKF